MQFPNRLDKKLAKRLSQNSLRSLSVPLGLIDFSSNDYLGFAKSMEIHSKVNSLLQNEDYKNGATGSRLLSGTHPLHLEMEKELAQFFNSETALLFNSGYDANIGLFSSVLQRGDFIFFDELIHASIRDGISMSNAKGMKFKHNSLEDLEKKLSVQSKSRTQENEIYVVTESVFSMDGDTPELKPLAELCKKYDARLVVDEAHAVGVTGKNGAGLVQKLELENEVFARIHTFGKALGCHGAAILGSEKLRTYLINFARSFIYTTAMPLHSVATIKVALNKLVILNDSEESQLTKLKTNINYFNQQLATNYHQLNFIQSNSAIHCCIISGNETVKNIAVQIQKEGFDVKPILSPTVPIGQERLRICLHSYNSTQEIDEILNLLGIFVAI